MTAADTTASATPAPAAPASTPVEPSAEIFDSAGLVVVGSPYGVVETLDRLTGIVEARGATVFARVDHSGGAANAGFSLRPMQLLIFGNPKLGTPALQASPTTGIDLPLRVLAWAQDGETFVAYPDVEAFASRHGLQPDDPAVVPIGRALEGLVGAAVKSE